MTMRYEKKWQIGDRGAVYEFDVKLSTRIRGVKVTDDELGADVEAAVEEFSDVLRSEYPWIGRVYLTGRSGGWLAIEDTRGKATKRALEKIRERVDQAREAFETATIETYGYGRKSSQHRNGSSDLYADALAAGLELDHHESALYIRDTPEARALLAKHGIKVDGHNASTFKDNIDGHRWIDVPFAYMPFWDKKAKRR